MEIARVGPPATPCYLTATPGDSQVALAWTASAAADLAGYRVYRGGALASGPAPLARPSWLDTAVANGTAYGYAVTAVDTAGTESARSATVTATPAAFTLRVNFSDAATAPPHGYVRDSGDAFAAARGYGWVQPGTTTPLSLAGNGRNRNPAAGQADVRLATLMHAQLPAGSAGVTTPGSWEAAVPNGTYTVTAAVGDAGTALDSVHWLGIEDQNAVAAFAPTVSTRHATATRTVTVADGRLTLSATGGTNTKFNYVDVASVPAAGCPARGTDQHPRERRHRRAADHQRGRGPGATQRRRRPGDADRLDRDADPGHRRRDGARHHDHQRRRRRRQPLTHLPAGGEHRVPLHPDLRGARRERARLHPVLDRLHDRGSAPVPAAPVSTRSSASPPAHPSRRWSRAPTAVSTRAPSTGASCASRSTPTALSARRRPSPRYATTRRRWACPALRPAR
nr:hypothetical protein GCM10020092_044920 [Actinoplanes digitatis]